MMTMKKDKKELVICTQNITYIEIKDAMKQVKNWIAAGVNDMLPELFNIERKEC